MIEETIKTIIQEIFKEQEIILKRIILFGSRSRGDYKKGSDWDLLVIVKENLSREQKIEIAHLIRKKLAEEFIPCDVLIRSDREVKKRKNIIGSVIREAIKEGIVL